MTLSRQPARAREASARGIRALVLGTVLGTCSLALYGCAPLLVGGAAATTVAVATDRRTAGEQVEDQAIEMKTGAEIRKAFEGNENVRVVATSYAGLVLLTGDVPSEADKQKAATTVAAIEHVKRVVNELRVGDMTPLSVRTNDTWITSKVRSTLIASKEIPSLTIVITTERGVVYLLGKVTAREGELAATAASRVNGVNKVVKLFDIVSPESVAQGQAATGPTQPSGTAAQGTPINQLGTPAAPGAATSGTAPGTTAVPGTAAPGTPGTSGGSAPSGAAQTMPVM